MKSSKLLFAFLLLSNLVSAQFIGPVKTQPTDYSGWDKVFELKEKQITMEAQRRSAEEERRKETIATCSTQIYDWYHSLDSHPMQISDGWHRAMITDKNSICDEMYVQIQDNKVTKFILNGQDTEEKNVYMSTSIDKGKCMIRLKFTDGTYSNFIDVFLIV